MNSWPLLKACLSSSGKADGNHETRMSIRCLPERGSVRHSQQPMVVRVGCRGGPGCKVEFRKNVAHVPGDGLFADVEPGGNTSIGHSRGDKSEHFDLTLR